MMDLKKFFLGSPSKTHKDRKDFTTKKGSKVYHRMGHYVRPGYKPYGSHKGTMSKTKKGRKNYTTKLGDKVYHRKGHYVRKSRRPYSAI
jgi:hypothetical protein